jgi:transcriptional regulator with XRE-family HTH domain
MTLQDWMDRHGLTDAALAEKLGNSPSRSQISRIRRQKSRPTPDTARKIEAVTKIPAASLVMGA